MLNNFDKCPVCGFDKYIVREYPDDHWTTNLVCTSFYPRRFAHEANKTNFHYRFKPGVFESVTIGTFIINFGPSVVEYFSLEEKPEFKSGFFENCPLLYEDFVSHKDPNEFIKNLIRNKDLLK